jgi:hypothetical protein
VPVLPPLSILKGSMCGTEAVKHLTAAVADLARVCLPGASAEWLERAVSNLDWFGHVILYHGPGGEPAAVQITEQGRQVADTRPSHW